MDERETPPTGGGGGWIEFDGPLEVLAWGRNTYTVVYLDGSLRDAVVAAATRRVEGWFDAVAVNLGVNKADVAPNPFLYVGAALQRRLDARAGDVVTCRLRPADPDHVPVPDDVQAALDASGGTAAFARRRPAERRRLLQPIENATQEATRRRRIEALITTLAPDNRG
ncbi:hypothetical protein Aab01nite_82190 [Paractinoplanes abujensis]|uniref:Bacteriocin resistance YdeI/OmpD-like protein n=1 Tax=Paractinoplanes abujensis TaxID=882441 RepID=A0A7W7CUV4_9ACTN|nr:YdeI/OmpD-associated family protein [Actinoplanes abujensis]MBB4693426.1 hypothetical protein [Actinoplanes abujensis]GID24629.1 hypothetical protein Aab01nite_82190 [Actinoplanes abujensis]